jgi:hypothetical protein
MEFSVESKKETCEGRVRREVTLKYNRSIAKFDVGVITEDQLGSIQEFYAKFLDKVTIASSADGSTSLSRNPETNTFALKMDAGSHSLEIPISLDATLALIGHLFMINSETNPLYAPGSQCCDAFHSETA